MYRVWLLGVCCFLLCTTVAARETALIVRWASVAAAHGYHVYGGPVAASERMTQLVTTTHTQVRLTLPRALRATQGQTVCLRVQAYDGTRVSAFSPPTCLRLAR